EGLRKSALYEFLGEESRRPFDLTEGPMFRATLVKIGVNEHVLVLVMHHIVTDEWSMVVLLEELSQLYAARIKGENSPLEDLKIQYADFALWQRSWLSGAVLEKQLDYWKKRLGGAPEMLELPSDSARPAVMKYEGSAHTFVLPQRLSQSLKEFSWKEG